MEPFEIELELRSELTGTERLLWSGLPRQGVVLRSSDVLLIPFSIMWAGFAFFWEYGVITGDAPFFFRLWGIPFVLAGIYMVIGRFFWDAWLRAHTLYGLTDRRVLIVTGQPTRQVTSLALQTLRNITLSSRGEGGTIAFSETGPLSAWQGSTDWPGSRRQIPPAFDLSDDARQIYERILEAQHAASPLEEYKDAGMQPQAVGVNDNDSFDGWLQG